MPKKQSKLQAYRVYAAHAKVLGWLEAEMACDLDALALVLDDGVRQLSAEQMQLLRRFLQRLPAFCRSRQEKQDGLAMIGGMLASEGGWRRYLDLDLVDRVMAWGEGDPTPLPIRSRAAFGVLDADQERLLGEAIRDGVLTRDDLLECVFDGEALTRRLEEAGRTLHRAFRTTDLSGMPMSSPDAGGWYGEPIELRTSGGRTYRLLICSETELDQVVWQENTTLDWLERTLEPDSVLYDVGANIGLYSLYSLHARKGVKVVAFEPAPMNFHRLLLNFELNGLGAETVFPFAVSDDSGVTSFAYHSLVPGACSHPGVTAPEGLATVAGAYRCSLDTLLRENEALPRPTHLKIDVDGHEQRILDGADATLRHPDFRHLVVETGAAVVPSLVEKLGSLGLRRVGEPLDRFGNVFFERLEQG